MHVFTRIVIFRLSSKEPDENVIVKHNIDQKNFLRAPPNFYFTLGPHLASGRACLGEVSTTQFVEEYMYRFADLSCTTWGEGDFMQAERITAWLGFINPNCIGPN